MSARSIQAVVVSWNSGGCIRRCLESIEKSQYSVTCTTVVDNASHDDSAATVRDAFPNVRVLQSNANLGFAGGNNRALAGAMEEHTDYVLLLNPDATLQPDALGEMIAVAAEHQGVGIVCPRIMSHDATGIVEAAGGRVSLWKGRVYPHGNGKQDSEEWHSVKRTGFCSGTAMLLRRDMLDEIGPFDEKFFMYHEDTDLCLRALAAGYEIWYAGKAAVDHTTSSSLGGYMNDTSFFYSSRNAFYLVKKHGTPLQRLVFSVYARAVYPAMVAGYSLLKRRPGLLRVYMTSIRAWSRRELGGPVETIR